MDNFDDQLRYLRGVAADLLVQILELRALRQDVAAIRLPASYGRSRLATAGAGWR
jgi:hypothetical protein